MLIVVNAEVGIGFAGHQQGVCADGLQRSGQIAIELRIGADVTGLPGAQLPEQIVGILAAEVAFPVADQKVVQARITKRAPEFFPVKGFGQRPACINAPHGLQAFDWCFLKPAIAKRRIGSQRRFDAAQKHLVVSPGTGRAAAHRNAGHRIAIQCPPVIRLLRAH